MKKELIRKLANESIKKWKSHLGFSGWKIDARVVIFKRNDNFPQDGDIVIDYLKKKAAILIGTKPKASVEEIVVHELVHLMLWPLDQKMMSAIKRLSQAKQKRIKGDFLGKLENVTAKITKAILHGGSGKKYKEYH